MRKKAGLTPSDVISLSLSDTAHDIVSKFENEMKKIVLAKEITYGLSSGEIVEIDNMKIFVEIVK